MSLNKMPIAERDLETLRQEKKVEMVCRVEYGNSLPNIPFDPKFIKYPFDPQRFVKYRPTPLELDYKYELWTDVDVGVPIDLLHKEVFAGADGETPLDPVDEKLLEDEVPASHNTNRSRHRANVSWLRKTEYISTERTRFQPQCMDKAEAQVGFNMKRSLHEQVLCLDRHNQILAIEKTFQDSKLPIVKHPSKPGITPVEILPVFPDFQNWHFPYAHVIFDSDPAPSAPAASATATADAAADAAVTHVTSAEHDEKEMEERLSHALIRGVMNEEGEQFVAHFLPTLPTLAKRRQDALQGVDYDPSYEYEYVLAREYSWSLKSRASLSYDDTYFFILRADGVFYNDLETRVRLMKRRQCVVTAGRPARKTRLMVRHRPFEVAETLAQQSRREQLLNPPAMDGALSDVEEGDDEQRAAAGESHDAQEATIEEPDRSNSSNDQRVMTSADV